MGITPQIDREACQYQIEVHVAPGVGYHRTRQSLEGIMSALMACSTVTGLRTAILPAYPIESDFHLTDDPKVQTARDLMIETNNHFPQYAESLPYKCLSYSCGTVIEVFRNQGTHPSRPGWGSRL
jgi:hypothetical protein